MNNNTLRDNIGQRVNIVNGKYELASEGAFLISTEFGSERVWLTEDGKSQCITKQPYIGRNYKIGYVDCVTLVCEHLNSNSLLKFYLGMGREELLLLQRETVMKWLDDDERFIDVGQAFQPGDCIVYSYTERMHANHIGIVYPNNKILHHLPGKLSCIDDLDLERVEKGYRFNE
jgi:hypothetical protein